MAKKDMDKKVRKMSSKKREAIHKMVEALIKGDSEEAQDHLHAYLQEKTRDLILGEAAGCENEEDMDDEEKEDDDKDSDDEDDDKEDKDDDSDKDKEKEDDEDDDKEEDKDDE